MKKLFILAMLAFPAVMRGQAVLVTATVQSSSGGQPYSSGNYQIALVDASGNPIQVPGYQSQFNGILSTAGLLSLNLFPNSQIRAGSQWKFHVCSAVPRTLATPAPVPSASCFNLAVTITGAGDISSTLDAAASPFYGCTQWSGSAWEACGGSGSFTALTGDATSTSTGGATTVVGINGTLLSGLATGILKNTTATGVPSIAVSDTDYQAPISLTTTGTSGAATFTGNVLNIPQYSGGGVTSVTGTAPVVSSGGTTPAISMHVADTSDNGYLASADWNTFNGKQAALSLLAGTYVNGDWCSYTSSGTLLNCNNAAPQVNLSLAAGTYVNGDYCTYASSGTLLNCNSTPSGSGTVSGQASGVIPLGTSSTVIGGQSHMDDGNTTAGTITSSEPVAATAFTATGTTPGTIEVIAGTGNIAALPSNAFGLAAPAATFTSVLLKPSGSFTSAGVLHTAASGTGDNVNESVLTTSTIATGDIAANAVTLAKLATQGANTVLCNETASSAVPTACALPAGVQYYTSASGYTAATSSQILTACTGCAPLASPSFTGTVTYPLIATTTHCAGAGTAANPSVVSCSAAPAGFFSCATNASTGTCVVDSTAVTANSVIQIQPDSSLGAALSVTCNTTADSGLTAPRISARSAGTSFTIALGTFTTNPECFSYLIIN